MTAEGPVQGDHQRSYHLCSCTTLHSNISDALGIKRKCMRGRCYVATDSRIRNDTHYTVDYDMILTKQYSIYPQLHKEC